ncbi:MAG: TetR/AcrR family transcriptional regulator [Steroidobacteraceae bacterium]
MNLKLYERLMLAAQKGLADRVHSELTAKEIAATAGTTEGMIQYYFGGKDQLTLAVLRRAVDDVSSGLRQLKRDILKLPGNPTLTLVRTIFSLAEPHEATTRLHAAELMRRSSAIKSVCGQPSYDVFGPVSEVIQHLVDAGIYSSKLNVGYATFVVMSLLESPVLHASAMEDRGLNPHEFKTDAWLGFCAGLLDQFFREPTNPALDTSSQ